MKKLIYFLIIITILGCKERNNERTEKSSTIQDEIQIEINENVETIGIILSLSGLGDYVLSHSREDRNYEFIRLIQNRFKDFKKHKAVLNFNNLNKLDLASSNYYYYGLSFSKLPEFKQIHPRYDEFYSNEKFSKSQVDSILEDFDASIRNFYKEAKVKEYITENKILYQKISDETKNSVPKNIISEMEDFFGVFKNKYVIISSPTIPNGWNFGTQISTKLSKTFYHLNSPSYDLRPKRENLNEITDKDSLGFDNKEKIRELAIHEFGHSFVRFLDKKENKELIEKLEYLNTIELIENLKKIGEGTSWSTGFEEHLIRASEIIVWKNLGNSKMASEKLKYEKETEGMLYINEFVASLEKYENERDKFKTLESYFTELISDLTKIKDNK